MIQINATTPEEFETILAKFEARILSGVQKIVDREKEAEEPDEQWDAKNIAEEYGISISTVIRHKAFLGAYNVGRNVRYSKKFVKAQMAKQRIR